MIHYESLWAVAETRSPREKVTDYDVSFVGERAYCSQSTSRGCLAFHFDLPGLPKRMATETESDIMARMYGVIPDKFLVL